MATVAGTAGTAGRPALAAGLVVAAMAGFGLIDNLMRVAAADGGLWQFHLMRAALALPVLALAAAALGLRLRPARPGRVLLRSLLNAGAMVVYFGGLGLLPAAQVVAGLFTAPLFVALFSVLLFGRRLAARQVVAILLGFAGVLLALGPGAGGPGADGPGAGAASPWLLLPVLAGALYGLGNLVTREWCRSEPTGALVAAFFATILAIGALGCAALWLWPVPSAPGPDGFVTRGWVAPSGPFLLVVLAQALGSLAGLALVFRAYQVADTGHVAVWENTLLVSATLWAALLWGERPGPAAVAGLLLVLAAGVLAAWPARPAPPGERA